MSGERASIFSSDIDLSEFEPTPPKPAARPKADKTAIRKAAEAKGFTSREPEVTAPTSDVAAPVAAPTVTPASFGQRRYRTGRNQQLNLKASPETVQRFQALCEARGWVQGEGLEHAVAALEREIGKGGAG